MEPLMIDLPPELRKFVQGEAAFAGLDRAEDFILRLIEEAQRMRWHEALEKIAEEAIESGPAVPWKRGDYLAMRDEWLKNRGKTQE